MNYPNLKPVCRLLALRLYANYGLWGPSFYTSESKLAEWCNVHRNAVGKNLKELKETGLITWFRGSRDPKAGQANQYDVSQLVEFVNSLMKNRTTPNDLHKNNAGADNLQQNSAGDQQQNNAGDLQHFLAQRATKSGTKENNKRMGKENQSSKDDDMSGSEAHDRFHSSQAFLEWAKSQNWGSQAGDDKTIIDLYNRMNAPGCNWTSKGKPVCSVKGLLIANAKRNRPVLDNTHSTDQYDSAKENEKELRLRKILEQEAMENIE